MEINVETAKAIVEKTITLDVNDCIALGNAFEPLKALVAQDDKYREFCKLPYDKRNEKNENGDYVIPRVESAGMSNNDIVDLARKFMPFFNKIAIFASDSNVFE